MLCPHCGSNEPEIRIGNKLFCSSCGLPLQKNDNLSREEKPKIYTNKDELTSAFSHMANTLSSDKGSTSYKSSNLSPSDSDEKSTNIVAESVATLDTQKPKEDSGVKEIDQNINISEGEEKVKKKAIKEAKEESDQLAQKIINELKKDDEKTEDVNVPEVQEKLEETVDKSSKEIPAVENSTKEPDKQEKHKYFNETVKDINQLGAASRLIDILEEGSKEEDIDKKKQKIKDQYKSAGRLLDILEKTEEIKPKTDKSKKESLKPDPLLDRKEIKSPLDTDEIALTKEDFKESIKKLETSKKPDKSEIPENVREEIKEELEDINEESSEDNKKEEVKAINIQKKDTPKEKPKEAVDIVTEWPNDDIEFDKLGKIDMEEEAEEEDQNKPDHTPTPVESIPEKETVGEKSQNTTIPTAKKSKKKKSVDIHNLGDKKEQLDHWPEEDVVDIDKSHLVEIDKEHPLTSYFKDVIDNKRKSKKEGKKKKSNIEGYQQKAKKKPKKKKKKVRDKTKIKKGLKVLKFILAFLLPIILILGGFRVFQDTFSIDIEATKEKALLETSFVPREPSYIPVGFQESLPIEGDSTSFTTTYTFVANKSKKITLKQTQGSFTEEDILDNYILGQTEEYTSETNEDNTIYYFNNEITFENNGVWYIIRATEDVDKNELKKIQESLL